MMYDWMIRMKLRFSNAKMVRNIEIKFLKKLRNHHNLVLDTV